MPYNTFIVDWTMADYTGLQEELAAAGFRFEKYPGADHLHVSVPHARLDEFTTLLQPHLTAPAHYVDVQFPEFKQTVLIFQDQVFSVLDSETNERVKAWAIARGVPPHQAEWGTSY